jgi:SpoVK/Ycf46/Vps4 family AAA+-type ATPase
LAAVLQGMEIIKQAVVADNADELETALSLYRQGLGYFMTGQRLPRQTRSSYMLHRRPADSLTACHSLSCSGLKYVKNDKAKIAIREKMNTYMSRAEQIKEALDKRSAAASAPAGPKKKAAVVAGGSASSKKDGGGEKKEGDDDEEEEVDPETAKLQAALSGAIVKETPNVKWEDVAGLEQAKALLKEAVILPVKFPQLFTGKRTPWKGILLYGPPGTGQQHARARMQRA